MSTDWGPANRSGVPLKQHCYAETDTRYIDLSSRRGSDPVEVADRLAVDFDEDGTVVGYLAG